MKWFYNFKIKTKLLVCFLILTIMSCIIGGIAIYNLQKITDQGSNLYEKDFLGVSAISKINSEYLEARVNIRNLVVFSEKDKTQYYENLKKNIENLNQYSKDYEKKITEVKDRENYEDFKSKIQIYISNIQNIIEASKARNNVDELAELFVAAAPNGTDVVNIIGVMSEWNNSQAKERTKNNESGANTTINMMIAIIICIFLVSVVLGLFVANIVSKPINKLVENANKVAEGNFEINMDINTKDEVGILSDSFKEIINSLKSLIKDTNKLANSAINGELDVRADSSNHKGEYATIIEGFNNTLDQVINPIRESSEVLEKMSKGNLSVLVTGNYKGDHAKIKESLNNTITSISSYIKEISEILSEMADGNLNVNITRDYMGDFVEIKESIGSIIYSFNEMISNINESADQVRTGAKQVAESSNALSQGSTEQASSIEELNSTMEQIASQTNLNAENANKANELAMSAKLNAQNGNDKMKLMLGAMNEINSSSSSISKIIKVIDEIAFQTNILALNAAVEAARAGQHGKGFAVVAEEVRNLAARSANAAKETTLMIEGSIQKVQEGTKIANETADALNIIVENVAKAANIVENIAESSSEQASGISQVNLGVSQVSQVTLINSSTAQQSASASEELSGQAELLKDMVSRFKIKKQNYDTKNELNPEILKVLEKIADNPNNYTQNIQRLINKKELALSKTGNVNNSKSDFGKY